MSFLDLFRELSRDERLTVMVLLRLAKRRLMRKVGATTWHSVHRDYARPTYGRLQRYRRT